MPRRKPRFTVDPPPLDATGAGLLNWAYTQLQRIEDWWPKDYGDRVTALEELQNGLKGEWTISGASSIRFEGTVTVGSPELECAATATAYSGGTYGLGISHMDYSSSDDVIVLCVVRDGGTVGDGGLVSIDPNTNTVTRETTGKMRSMILVDSGASVIASTGTHVSADRNLTKYDTTDFSVEVGPVGLGAAVVVFTKAETADGFLVMVGPAGYQIRSKTDLTQTQALTITSGYTAPSGANGNLYAINNASYGIPVAVKRTSDSQIGAFYYTSGATIGGTFKAWDGHAQGAGYITNVLGNPVGDSSGNIWWLCSTTDGRAFVKTDSDGDYLDIVVHDDYADSLISGYDEIAGLATNTYGYDYLHYDSATNALYLRAQIVSDDVGDPTVNAIIRYVIASDIMEYCQVQSPNGWTDYYPVDMGVYYEGAMWLADYSATRTSDSGNYVCVVKQEIGGYT